MVMNLSLYNSLNEKLRMAIKEDCKGEIKQYKKEMNELLKREE